MYLWSLTGEDNTNKPITLRLSRYLQHNMIFQPVKTPRRIVFGLMQDHVCMSSPVSVSVFIIPMLINSATWCLESDITDEVDTLILKNKT